jgi:cellulose synthase/poly-beta-1,6-N-acetylglucosamine synthase-like glycosyltransferase
VPQVVVWEEGITAFSALLRQRRRWAEGSICRYLENVKKLLTIERVPLRNKADLIAYFVQFLFPIWLLMDYMIYGFEIIFHDPTHFRSVAEITLLPMLSLFFTLNTIISITRYKKLSWFQYLFQGIQTSLYFLTVWIPVVFWVLGKMLFQRQKTLDWGKTNHTGASSSPPSQTVAV